jgi:tRNA(fMet)-specific endonuclease VapC
MLTLLDTDTLSLHLKGHPQVMAYVQAYAQQHGILHFSLITHYEILNGLFYKDARQQLGRYESLLLDSRLIPLTPESVRVAANISAGLRAAGQIIGHTDVLIAGVALANGMQLATNNTRHFERIEGLHLVNWTQ